MHFTALVTLSVFISSALASPHLKYVCEPTDNIPLRVDPGTGKDVKPDTCITVNNGNAPFYEYKDGDLQATLSSTKVAPAGATCEHIMEIQMLSKVFESPSGPCDQLKALPLGSPQRTALRNRYREITDIINSPPNLVFAADTLEKPKGVMVLKSTRNEPFKQDSKDPNQRKRLQAVDYFVNTQTKADTLHVAQALDAKIAQIYPGTTAKVEDLWNNVLNFAHTCYNHLT